ncbi:MAG: tetratricopeptide repeat protein, partial [Gammaproteobacteria bacterium]|nr:tetratricopeptide repeat protein [Gammaproteobacteria bacterium]
MNPAELNHELADLTRQMAAGELQLVEKRTNSLLQTNPDEPRLLCLLGRVERLQDKRDLARMHLETAARLAPRAMQVMSELGYLALAEEAYASAEGHFARVVNRNPANSDALFNLGIALRQQGKHQSAIAVLERCLVQSSDQLQQVHTELGTAHIMQRHEAAALEHFEQALAIDREYAPALHGMGMVKSAFGEFDEAADYFRAAMKHDPDFVEAYQQLVSISRFDGSDHPDIQTMEKIVADSERKSLTRETLHYALGKVYDDCGEFEQAFAHFVDANALRKARLPAFDVARM